MSFKSRCVKPNVFKRFYFVFLSCLIFSAPLQSEDLPYYPRADTAQKKFFAGERLVYQMTYLGVHVGTAEATVGEVQEMRGRRVYPISVKVASSKVIDLVFKVRDEHRTYIDAEKLYPLQYEKIISEGKYHADEVMTYDQDKHTAHYFSRTNKSEKEMLIPPEVQDQLSCGYWFRTQDIRPGTKVTIPVNADEKNWQLEVDIFDVESVEIEKVGRFDAMVTEPKIKFQGIFVKRGKIRGWLSMDERRIPLKMTVKIPFLGSVTALLEEYQPGKA